MTPAGDAIHTVKEVTFCVWYFAMQLVGSKNNSFNSPTFHFPTLLDTEAIAQVQGKVEHKGMPPLKVKNTL